MASVLRIEDKRLSRQGALKIMLPELASDPEAVQRFLREAEHTASLNHPGIPAVYDYGFNAQNQAFLLMEVVEGKSLDQLLKSGEFSLEQSLEVLKKVAEAVAFAHSRDFIHRDLKPSNIMVGQFGEVKVMDWGLVRKLDSDQLDDIGYATFDPDQIEKLKALEAASGSALPELTQAGSFVGTLGYASPEQCGGEAIGPATDIFALGAILTVILTGETPIERGSPIERFMKTIKGQIRTPSQIVAGVSGELNSLASTALNFNPDQRPNTAVDFAREIDRFNQKSELQCHKYGPGDKLRRLIARHSISLVVMGLILICFALAAVVFAVVERNNRLTINSESQRLRRLAAEAKSETLKRESELEKAKAEASRQRANRAQQLLQLKEQERENLAIISASFTELETRLANGDEYSEIRKIAVDVISRSNGNPHTVVQLGRICQRAQHVELALRIIKPVCEELSKAKRLDRAEIDLLLHWHELSLELQHSLFGPTAALNVIRAASKKQTLAPEIQAILDIELALFKQEIHKTLRRAESSHKDYPNNFYFNYYLSYCYTVTEAFNSARNAADRAIALRPLHTESRIIRAGLHLRFGEFDRAIADLHIALANQPENPRVFRLLSEYYRSIDSKKLAIFYIDNAIRLNPTNPVYVWSKAETCLSFRDFEEGRRLLKILLGLAANQRAKQIANSELKKLSELRKKTSYIHRFEVERHYLRALNFRQLGLPERALQRIKRAIEGGTNQAKLLIAQALIYQDLNQDAEALAIYESLFKQKIRKSQFAAILNNRAKLLFRRSHFKQCVDDLTKAIELAPTTEEAYSIRAQAYLKLREFEKAVKDYRHLLTIKPRLRQAHEQLCLIYFHHLKNYDLALHHAEKYTTVHPKTAETGYYIRARCYISLGETKLGRKLMSEFQQRFPNSRHNRTE